VNTHTIDSEINYQVILNDNFILNKKDVRAIKETETLFLGCFDAKIEKEKSIYHLMFYENQCYIRKVNSLSGKTSKATGYRIIPTDAVFKNVLIKNIVVTYSSIEQILIFEFILEYQTKQFHIKNSLKKNYEKKNILPNISTDIESIYKTINIAIKLVSKDFLKSNFDLSQINEGINVFHNIDMTHISWLIKKTINSDDICLYETGCSQVGKDNHFELEILIKLKETSTAIKSEYFHSLLSKAINTKYTIPKNYGTTFKLNAGSYLTHSPSHSKKQIIEYDGSDFCSDIQLWMALKYDRFQHFLVDYYYPCITKEKK
jgi:hypothetical protein